MKGAGYPAMLVASVPPSNASTPVTLSLLGAIQIGSTRPWFALALPADLPVLAVQVVPAFVLIGLDICTFEPLALLSGTALVICGALGTRAADAMILVPAEKPAN